MQILIVVRDYKVKLNSSETLELAKYELSLIAYLKSLKNDRNLINLDAETKIILSYNNINYKDFSDNDIYLEELNLINEIKKFSNE